MDKPRIIDIFDVALPCQRFYVTASVSGRTKLELAEEYALRLVHTLGAATQADFQHFFGFPTGETLDLITWLMRNEFIETRDGMLKLGPRGALAFHESEDGAPVLIKPTEIRQTIALERITYTPVSQFSVPIPTTVPELPTPDNDLSARQLVSAAVEQHYDEWSKEWKRSTDVADMLYGVHAVSSQNAFLSRESVPLMLDTASGRIDHQLDLSAMQRRGRIHSRDALVAAVRQFIYQTVFPADSQDALAFAESFDRGLLSAYSRLGRFDIKRWLYDPPKAAKGTWTFVGSPVSDEVYDLLTRFTEPEETALEQTKGSPIIWVAPQHRFWGACTRYAELLGRMGSISAGRGGIVLISRRREQRAGLRPAAQRDLLQFAKAPTSLVFADASAFPQAIEMIIEPGKWVLAIVYQRHGPENLPIGAGFLSLDPSVIQSAVRAVGKRLLKVPFSVSTLRDGSAILEAPTNDLQNIIKTWAR